MSYTPEQLLAMPDAERDAIAAEVCMGWRRRTSPIQEPYYVVIDTKDHVIDCIDWQPSQPTEKGKAQAWELEEEYQMLVHPSGFSDSNQKWSARGLFTNSVFGAKRQAVVVTAAILAAQAEQEK